MIEQYKPLHPPDPQEWLALDETTRIILVLEYHNHTKASEEMADDQTHVHAVVHTVVENQIALGDEYPVKNTIQRLMDEGQDRHDAIHAIGSVLIKYLWRLGQDETPLKIFLMTILKKSAGLRLKNGLMSLGEVICKTSVV